jgi:hypothetical protein
MATNVKPEEDSWYEDDSGRVFKVVVVDMDEGAIEIQNFDGDVEEIDLEVWKEMELVSVAEPEDWTGPFDDLEEDDLGDTETPRRPEDWNGPADEMDYEK